MNFRQCAQNELAKARYSLYGHRFKRRRRNPIVPMAAVRAPLRIRPNDRRASGSIASWDYGACGCALRRRCFRHEPADCVTQRFLKRPGVEAEFVAGARGVVPGVTANDLEHSTIDRRGFPLDPAEKTDKSSG